MKKVIIVVMAVFLCCACKATAEQELGASLIEPPECYINEELEKPVTKLPKNDGDGEGIMSEYLLTVEEFLRRVSENEKALGVAVTDFDDINVADFIDDCKINERLFEQCVLGERMLGSLIRLYKSNLLYRQVEKYRATESVVVNSTNEEYEAFKTELFERIGGATEKLIWGDGYAREYAFQEGSRFPDFVMGRTMYIVPLKWLHWRFPEDPFQVFIPDGGDGAEYGAPLYHSKSGKYFLAIYESDAMFIIEYFCEIDG
jgi:hypothetical protein